MKEINGIFPEDESLEKEAPLLHSISKVTPFSVPQNYFDSLPSEIVEKCRKNVNKVQGSTGIQHFKLFVLGYKWRLLTVSGCAAVICFFLVHIGNNSVSYMAMAQNIPDSLIVAHFDNNITDVNMLTLEDLSADSAFAQIAENMPAPVKTASDSANTDQDIIAYLINNNVSVSDIENEP